jgi:TatD DNase family protein
MLKYSILRYNILMIDVHCHLNLKGFEKDTDEVIKRAFKVGVEKIINVGTSLESSKKAVELASKYDNLYAIIGVHPHHADKVNGDWISELKKIAQNDKVVGIGEIGMDYYSYSSNGIVNASIQREIFEKQIIMAFELNLPLQIHNRHAGEDVIEILKKHKDYLREIPGMFHCFAGNHEVLRSALEMGFYIGFDGNITYSGLAKGETVTLETLCDLTPIDKIVIETDAPFLAPEPERGGRNEPSYVIITGRKIAQIKHISFEELDRVTTGNAKKVFKL